MGGTRDVKTGARRRILVAIAGAAMLACVQPSARRDRPGGGEPSLRVGLHIGVEEIQIGTLGAARGIDDRGLQTDLLENRPLTVVRSGELLTVQAGGEVATPAARITFQPAQSADFILVNNVPYRGVIEVYPHAAGLAVINVVGVEQYLYGVVPVELGPRPESELEALKAQAIASRTYALKNRNRFQRDGYDIRASVTDQVYGGVPVEHEAASLAVRATRGRVIAYRGELINAFFHSTCGSVTASPEEAFRSVRELPYLRSVSDEREGGYFCDISPHFRWEIEWEQAELQDILRRTIPRVLGVDDQSVTGLRGAHIRQIGPSGRAMEVRVEVDAGEIPIFAPDIRNVFQRPDGRALMSTAIQLSMARSAGELRRLTATGAGSGHGVGLCQWGSIGRARHGQSHEDILAAYYHGTTLQNWY